MNAFDISQPPPSQSRIDAMRFAAYRSLAFLWVYLVANTAAPAYFAWFFATGQHGLGNGKALAALAVCVIILQTPAVAMARASWASWRRPAAFGILVIGLLGSTGTFIALQMADPPPAGSLSVAWITMVNWCLWACFSLALVFSGSFRDPAYYRPDPTQAAPALTAPQAIAYHEAVVAMGRPLAAGEVEALLKAEQPDEARAAGAVGNKQSITANASGQ